MKNKTIAVALVFFIAFSLSGCLRYNSNLLEVTRATDTAPSNSVPYSQNYAVPTSYYPNQESTTQYPDAVPGTTLPDASASVPNTTLPAVTTPAPTATQPAVTSPVPASVPSTTAAPAPKDPSQWSKTEILTNLTKAVNDTKAFTGSVSVDHTEEFSNFNITKCPGGQIGINLANRIAGGFMKPSTETVSFSGGTGTMEDETVPLLLPKRGAFSLTADGIKSARAMQNGGQTVIEITLVQESGSLNDVPKHNSAAIGYMDPSKVDLSVITIDKFNVTYEGSTLIVTIDAQGRVVNAAYTIPVLIDAAGSGPFGIKGEFSCTGTQKEIWKINW